MVKIRQKCNICDGKGHLPALGSDGDATDMKRFFPRLCESCNGEGKVLSNVEIEGNEKDNAKDNSSDD